MLQLAQLEGSARGDSLDFLFIQHERRYWVYVIGVHVEPDEAITCVKPNQRTLESDEHK
jgi:hypothetical protein